MNRLYVLADYYWHLNIQHTDAWFDYKVMMLEEHGLEFLDTVAETAETAETADNTKHVAYIDVFDVFEVVDHRAAALFALKNSKFLA